MPGAVLIQGHRLEIEARRIDVAREQPDAFQWCADAGGDYGLVLDDLIDPGLILDVLNLAYVPEACFLKTVPDEVH